VTVAAGASQAIVNEGVSGDTFLELRSIQCTPNDDVKMIVEVDKDTILTIATKTLGESPEKALGVFVIADERKTLKVSVQNSGAGPATLSYLINGLLKQKAKEE
jgi:hypothetical protein